MLTSINFNQLKSAATLEKVSKSLPIVQWVVWIVTVFILAKIFWIWVLYFTAPTEIKDFSVPVTVNQSVKNENNIDINRLVNRNLFGSVVVKAAPKQQQIVDAPETKLNLKLRGIYAADTKDKANAIIEDSGGKQAVYFIDEKLEVSGRVYLRQVYPNKVILETNGRNETLTLESEELLVAVAKKADSSLETKKDDKKQVNDKRNNQRISKKLNDYKNQYLNDPKSVSDVISGRPHFVDGELRGFSIAPGRDKNLFQELGLRQGDVVTSINGISLTNMQDAMTLMNDAQSIDNLSVDIDRDGESVSLLLNLSDRVGM